MTMFEQPKNQVLVNPNCLTVYKTGALPHQAMAFPVLLPLAMLPRQAMVFPVGIPLATPLGVLKIHPCLPHLPIRGLL